MSFNPPHSTPSFSTDRAQEDNYWTKQNHVDGRASTPSSKITSSYAYPRSSAAAGLSTSGANDFLHANGGGGSSQHHHNHYGHNQNHTRTESIKDKIGGLLNGGQSARDLPMYKDKPRFPSGKRGGIRAALFPRGRRKRWIVLGSVALFLFWWSYTSSSSSSSSPSSASSSLGESSEPQPHKESWFSWFNKKEIDWNVRREMVKQAFITSWDDYAKHAWGMDEYSPISKKGSMMVRSRQAPGEPGTAGMGWIIVDALDTAMMMNLTSRVAQAREWIATSLDFAAVDGPVSTFETTIRVLGGLLSAHYLSTTFPNLAAQTDDDKGARGEDLYIEKAVDLADRLLGAFDTPSGIPLSSVNLNTSGGVASRDVGGASSTAEAATLQLELKYLAKLTGEPLYWQKAEDVMRAVDAPRREGGLVPIFIDAKTGEFQGSNIRLGSRGDSYYEYLIKQYLQTGGRETVYSEMWEEALEGMKTHLISFSKFGNFTVLGERAEGLHGPLSGKMDHLVCFLPGTIALGVTGGQTVTQAKKRLGSAWGKKQEDDLLLAEELMKTCWGMYAVTPTQLAPEITYMVIDSPPREYLSNSTDPDLSQTWVQPKTHVKFTEPNFHERQRPASQRNAWHQDYDIRPNDVHNLQRPETVESLFYLYRITGNSMYREWGWEMFQSFQKHTRVLNEKGVLSGFTSIDDVLHDPTYDPPIPSQNPSLTGVGVVSEKVVGTRPVSLLSSSHVLYRDNMEGFWLAETLKYFYLLFSDSESSAPFLSGGRGKTNVIHDDWFDLTKIVINTEAHFFPRFDIKDSKVWKTGWTRKQRGQFEAENGGGEEERRRIKIVEMEKLAREIEKKERMLDDQELRQQQEQQKEKTKEGNVVDSSTSETKEREEKKSL